MDEVIKRVEAAQQLREAFVLARQRMNAAIPDVINATPAERALYSERYKADHEAERAFWSAALEVFQDGSITALLDRIKDQSHSNRETLHKLIVEAVGRCLHTNHGLEAEQIAGFVLDRLPSPPDTGE